MKHIFGFKQAGGEVLSPGGTGLGARAVCQVMPIPSAQHPTFLSAEIMESQHHLDRKNPLRASSPIIPPVLSSCSTMCDWKLHSGMGNYCSSIQEA